MLAYQTCHSTVLYGIPNNNQLAVALLRQSERQKTPLPPPPNRMSEADSRVPVPLTSDVLSSTGSDLPLGASPEDLLDATAPNDKLLDEAGGDDTEVSKTNSKEPPQGSPNDERSRQTRRSCLRRCRQNQSKVRSSWSQESNGRCALRGDGACDWAYCIRCIPRRSGRHFVHFQLSFANSVVLGKE